MAQVLGVPCQGPILLVASKEGKKGDKKLNFHLYAALFPLVKLVKFVGNLLKLRSPKKKNTFGAESIVFHLPAVST